MGLTTFKGNHPTLKEAVVAKNYLSEKELRSMGQLVSGYLGHHRTIVSAAFAQSFAPSVQL